jgi:predicted nuclease with TOPRIM domain
MFEPEDKPMGDASLKALSEKSNELQNLDNKIKDVEEELGKLKSKYRELSEVDIPSMLSELGLSEITLADGNKISTATYYSARISDDKRDEAFSWLNDNGFADIIKNTVSVSFGRDEDDSARKLVDSLEDNGYATAQKKWVEPMTLKAFVREQVEKGSDLPLETFNVYIGQKTRIIKK